MSKEKTPIEVDEFIEQQNLKLKSPMEGYVLPFSQLKNMLEQYAQAVAKKQVLEALEREVPKAVKFGQNNGVMMEAGLERSEHDEYTQKILRNRSKI